MLVPPLGLFGPRPDAIAASARILGGGDPAEWMREAGLAPAGRSGTGRAAQPDDGRSPPRRREASADAGS